MEERHSKMKGKKKTFKDQILREVIMLYLSTLLIEHKDVETFDEFLEVVRQKAVEGEMFIRFDLKPPFPDTPENWQDRVESVFSGYIRD